MICKTCGRELPEDRFEMTSTGYRRHMCRQCRWALVQKPYLERRESRL
ncbi:MAG: hypothetical protein J5610_05160 [Prevotella sp.]|nr:hypothetical protein [Prevotella sp.]